MPNRSFDRLLHALSVQQGVINTADLSNAQQALDVHAPYLKTRFANLKIDNSDPMVREAIKVFFADNAYLKGVTCEECRPVPDGTPETVYKELHILENVGVNKVRLVFALHKDKLLYYIEETSS